MKVLVFVLFTVFCTGQISTADDDIKLDEGVLVLTKGNFQKALADNEYMLVEFCKYFFCYWTSLAINLFELRRNFKPSFF